MMFPFLCEHYIGVDLAFCGYCPYLFRGQGRAIPVGVNPKTSSVVSYALEYGDKEFGIVIWDRAKSLSKLAEFRALLE